MTTRAKNETPLLLDAGAPARPPLGYWNRAVLDWLLAYRPRHSGETQRERLAHARKECSASSALPDADLERHDAEAHARRHYSTPAKATEALLGVIDLCASAATGGFTRPLRVLEPCAGEGAIVRVVASRGAAYSVDAWEIEPSREQLLVEAGASTVKIEDLYVQARVARREGQRWPLILANFPFEAAVPMATALLPLLEQGGVLAFYCRAAVTETERRARWFSQREWARWDLADRQCHVAGGKKDQWATSWFVTRGGCRTWPAEEEGRETSRLFARSGYLWTRGGAR